MPPVILLAFANDRAGTFLRSIAEEQRAITQALAPLREKKLLQVEVLSNATAADIFAAFRRYRDRVRVFHYGGHAQDLDLLLSGSERPLHMPGLAQFLAQQKGLELVFMNGCATAAQQAPLTAAGIPRLILTETAINDAAAQQFAGQFYQALASGRSVAQGFAEAEGAAIAQLGAARRSLTWQEKDAEAAEDSLPWRLHRSQEEPFALRTERPFPWARAITGALLFLALAGGGYGLWRLALPFDLRVPVQYPPAVTDAHFRYAHQLRLSLPDQPLTASLDASGRAVFDRVTGQLAPVPVQLQSPLWALADSQLTLRRNPQPLRLVWKKQLRHIRGRVLDQASQRPIADAQVALGDRRVRTDAAGNYDLPVPEDQVPALSHRLRITHPAYAPRRWTVNLADGQERYEILLP